MTTSSRSAQPTGGKLIAFGVVGALLAFCFGFVGASSSLQAIGASLLVLTFVLLPFLYIQVLFLANHRKMLSLLILGESTAMALPFLLASFSTLHLIAWLAVLLILWSASRTAAKAEDNELHIKFFGIGQAFFARAFIGCAIFIILTFVNSFHFSLTTISRETVFSLVKPLTPLMQLAFKSTDFSLEMTQRQTAEVLVRTQPQIQKLTGVQRKAAMDQIEKNLHNLLKEKYGIDWKSGETLLDVLHGYLSVQWTKWPTWAKVLLPVGIGLVLLSIIKFLGIILRPLSALFAFLCYKICIWTKLAVIELEKRDKEVIAFA
jgi:hypothetical protein